MSKFLQMVNLDFLARWIEAFNQPGAKERWKQRKPPFHPTINRWTGQPHEHKREIARRLRSRV